MKKRCPFRINMPTFLFILVIFISGCVMRDKEFTKNVLDNGLTVIVREVHTSPICAVHFWVNTGSVNEPIEINGISHFYEHMFFKGTEKWKVGEMDRVIKELGGYNNAFTSVEYTGYYVVVPSQNFTTAFNILLDALKNSAFDPIELEKERKVIKEEINRKEDAPGDKLSMEFMQEIFKEIPYGKPVLGTKESVDRIDREAFIKYMKDFYVPNNMALIIVGDVDTKEVISEVRERTREMEPDHNVHLKSATFEFSIQKGTREKVIEKDVKQTYMIMGFPNYGRALIDEFYALDVASTILGGGKSSRLYQRLLEKEGIVTSISAWMWPLKKAGIFGIEVVCPPQNFESVKLEIFEEVKKIRDKGVSKEELDRAKTLLVSDFAFSNETDTGMASTLGRYEMESRAEDAWTYVKNIEKVTSEDIHSVLNKYCLEDRWTMCVIKPKKETPAL